MYDTGTPTKCSPPHKLGAVRRQRPVLRSNAKDVKSREEEAEGTWLTAITSTIVRSGFRSCSLIAIVIYRRTRAIRHAGELPLAGGTLSRR